MNRNPWQVDSIEAFSNLKCPESTHETIEKTIFKYNALENHPLSHALFGTTESDNSDTKKTNMYNPNDIKKYIDENYKFIFTLYLSLSLILLFLFQEFEKLRKWRTLNTPKSAR